MAAPLVSCVLTTYNSARFVAEALTSVAAQEHPRLEVLVCDDGSTDETAAIVAAHPLAATFSSAPNAGPPVVRNRGWRAARGAYVAFLDADDRWLPGKLRRQVAELEARPGLAWSVTRLRTFWMPELAEEEARLRGQRRAGEVAGYVASTLMVRREVGARFGMFDEGSFTLDIPKWIRAAEEAGLEGSLLDAVLVERRMHAANLTRTHTRACRSGVLDLVAEALRRKRAAGPGA